MNPMRRSITEARFWAYSKGTGGNLDSGSGLDRADQGIVFWCPRYHYPEDTKQYQYGDGFSILKGLSNTVPFDKSGAEDKLIELNPKQT
jgi:hypothetical protein